MWEGVESADKDPRKSLHVGEVPLPELAPDEVDRRRDGQLHQLQHGVDLDLRAAADLRVPRPPRQGVGLGRAPRPGLPRGRFRRRRVWCCRSARRCATGSRATASRSHCNYVDDQDPSAHNDSMLAANQRIWGFETNFGGLADLAIVKANQLMPKPAHLTLGGGGGQRAVRLHQLPDARRRPRRPHEAGRQRVHLGRHRRHRRLRHPAGAQRRRHPGRRGLLARAGQAAQRDGVRARDRPPGRGLPVLVRRAHPGRARVAPPRQEGPRAGRRGPRHRVRAPRPLDVRRLGVHHQARRQDRHLRRHLRLHDRVRQPSPVDEAQEHHLVALRQLPGGVGDEPPHRQGCHPAGACPRCSPSTRSARPR